ncbi:MAG TPA: hypothetical protein VHB98_24010 [Chloroflexota bacterium]|jgi:hypothetical protein|nr:hypothetical protein [Chloroflexota bacterium]
MPLEGPDEWISLNRAATLSGVSSMTLRRQVYRGHLRITRSGYAWVTTRRWLHDYLQSRPAGGQWRGVPEDYQAPA